MTHTQIAINGERRINVPFEPVAGKKLRIGLAVHEITDVIWNETGFYEVETKVTRDGCEEPKPTAAKAKPDGRRRGSKRRDNVPKVRKSDMGKQNDDDAGADSEKKSVSKS